ncbi:TPA: hypothetical protein HA265_05785, partial [Candidatus Woesearchaeota archaeon]|nr:hypothetical protein [Candidatus Woesearchaeota archaeon]
VLEALIDPKRAEKKPWNLFILGIVYASFALLLSWWITKDHASLIMITLTAICSVPLIYSTIKYEEEKDESDKKEYWLIKEHGKAISAFTFLFLGFVAAFTLWFIFLPSSSTQTLFSVQIETITHITKMAAPTGNLVQSYLNFVPILMNNLKILIFCFLLSFFFGAGSIFILTWNASVVAVAIGVFIRNEILSKLGPTVSTYFGIVSLGIMKYMTHGIVEIIAYFVGALAGGILSVAVIRHDFNTPEFKKVLLDATDGMAISVILLFIAAMIEVFITPLLI